MLCQQALNQLRRRHPKPDRRWALELLAGPRPRNECSPSEEWTNATVY
jgi:hypothetical protein